MALETVSYIELYKLKAVLLKQIKDLDVLMQRIIPSDDDKFNKLANEITLGLYDYPFNQNLEEKIFFSLEKLKVADANEIFRYMKIIGDNQIQKPSFKEELEDYLKLLVDKKILCEISSITNDKNIKYEII
jgi:hypothetical protein